MCWQGPHGLWRHDEGQRPTLEVVFAGAVANNSSSASKDSSRKRLSRGFRTGDLVKEHAQVSNHMVAIIVEPVDQEGGRGVAEGVFWGRGGKKGAHVEQEEGAAQITDDRSKREWSRQWNGEVA